VSGQPANPHPLGDQGVGGGREELKTMVEGVRCIYLYIVISPYVRGFPAYLHMYLYYILWPLAPR
jgi:hypothetical protein